LRYYEKQTLLDAPARKENGYRAYTESHVARVRFIRGAQALGFSLAEIRSIIPRLSAGKLGRTEIEQHLQAKMAQIDAHIKQLHSLKKELTTTFASLKCSANLPVSVAEATPLKATASGQHTVALRKLRKVRSV
jgi:MerR family transcriptional regulator, copper efflux regulator